MIFRFLLLLGLDKYLIRMDQNINLQIEICSIRITQIKL